MSKVVVATLMGIILLVLCVKFFCCRKSQSNLYENAEQPQDSDDADKNELTRINSGPNIPKPKEQSEEPQIRKKVHFEVSKEDEEDEDEQ